MQLEPIREDALKGYVREYPSLSETCPNLLRWWPRPLGQKHESRPGDGAWSAFAEHRSDSWALG